MRPRQQNSRLVALITVTTIACSEASLGGPQGPGDSVGGDSGAPGDTLPETPLTPVFFSDFATATGAGSAAMDDGGKWDVVGGAGQVITNDGSLGLPSAMQNVLEVSWSGGAGAWRVGPPFGAGIGAVAVGTTRYYRYYFRQVQPNGTADTQTHPIQDGSGGSQTNWTLQCYNNVGDGVWKMGHGFWDNPFPVDQFQMVELLDKGVTYRLEHAIERVSDTTFRFDTRVFDETSSATVPLYDGDDFYAAGSASQQTMTEYFASGTLTFNDVVNLDGLNAGVNDNDPLEPGNYAYQGGFAVVDNQGWIGPYGSVAGEAR